VSPELELPADAPDLAGTQYVLERLLGEGGFGQAYLAYNNGLRRRCVLKVLTDIDNPGFVARFYREAQVMANLEHPTIPRVHEVATTKAGQPFFVMEFVDGKSLGDHLADEGGTLDVGEAARLVADAAEGLAAAHEMGVIHRDVKLANLLVNKRGQIKVIDFGIAQRTIEDGQSANTVAGQIFGTPRYMSPEQALGKALGPESDFYALGVVLFILLTGQSPFEGTPLEMMTAHVHEVPPKLAHVAGTAFPPAIETLVARLLAKDPAARFSNGEELAADLREAGHVEIVGKKPAVAISSRGAGTTSTADRDAATGEMASRARTTGSPSAPRRTDVRLGDVVRRTMVVEPSVSLPILGTDDATVFGAGAHAVAFARTERALAPVTAHNEGQRAVDRERDEHAIARTMRADVTPSSLQTSVGLTAPSPKRRGYVTAIAVGAGVLCLSIGVVAFEWARSAMSQEPAAQQPTDSAPIVETTSASVPTSAVTTAAAPAASTPVTVATAPSVASPRPTANATTTTPKTLVAAKPPPVTTAKEIPTTPVPVPTTSATAAAIASAPPAPTTSPSSSELGAIEDRR
jgi:predicted Ser/Thr protein kinase